MGRKERGRLVKARKKQADPDFVTAKERYGVWPLTVWDLDAHDPTTRALKGVLRDAEVRDRVLYRPDPTACWDRRASAFSPATASFILNLYAPKHGVCFDPFAGGGTRATMAAAHGLRYMGAEIRAEEVTALRRKARRHGSGEEDGGRTAEGLDVLLGAAEAGPDLGGDRALAAEVREGGVQIRHRVLLAPPPVADADLSQRER